MTNFDAGNTTPSGRTYDPKQAGSRLLAFIDDAIEAEDRAARGDGEVDRLRAENARMKAMLAASKATPTVSGGIGNYQDAPTESQWDR